MRTLAACDPTFVVGAMSSAFAAASLLASESCAGAPALREAGPAGAGRGCAALGGELRPRCAARATVHHSSPTAPATSTPPTGSEMARASVVLDMPDDL